MAGLLQQSTAGGECGILMYQPSHAELAVAARVVECRAVVVALVGMHP